jgi:hypothetical protein
MRFEKIWIEQCRATRAIKRHFGANDALDYLVGEKLRVCARRSGRSSTSPDASARRSSSSAFLRRLAYARIALVRHDRRAGRSCDRSKTTPVAATAMRALDPPAPHGSDDCTPPPRRTLRLVAACRV